MAHLVFKISLFYTWGNRQTCMTFGTSTHPCFELLFPHNYKERLDEIKLRYLSTPTFFSFCWSLLTTTRRKRKEKEELSPYYMGFCNRVGKRLCKEPDDKYFRPWGLCNLCPLLSQLLNSTFHSVKAAIDNVWVNEHSSTSTEFNQIRRGLDLALWSGCSIRNLITHAGALPSESLHSAPSFIMGCTRWLTDSIC